MFRSASKPLTPAEIYATSLERFSLGHPLWSPAPQSLATSHDPVEPHGAHAESLQTSADPAASAEPQVADVGFIFEGGFIRLFHLDTAASEKKVTHLDPPFDRIAQLEKNTFLPMKKPNPLQAGHYCSRGVTSKEAHASVVAPTGPNASLGLKADYTCREARGAALTLQSDADVVVSLPSKLLRQYIRRHVSTWHDYVTRDLGLYLKQEEIAVVIGWTKTAPDWAVTAFGVDDEVREYAQPKSHLADRVSRKDQSVFLKLARAKKRLFLPLRIVAKAGYDNLPPWRRRVQDALEETGKRVKDEENYAERCWEEYTKTGRVPDRLDIIQDYIFEVSAATVAIASDDQVESLLCGRHVIDFASWLRKVQPGVEMSDDKVGSLRMEDVIRCQQELRFTDPPIMGTDTVDWPQITRKNAPALMDSQILLGPTEAKTCSATYKHAVFGNANEMQIFNPRYASLSADGKLLATTNSTAIVVWRLRDGPTVQELVRDERAGSGGPVSFSPDGQHIVSICTDKLVLVWNVKTGKVVHHLKGSEAPVEYTVFSPDGRQIATRCEDSLRIWDSSSGDLLHAITDLDYVEDTDIVFSPDSSLLAAQSNATDEDTSVVVLDCRTGARIATLRRQEILCMAFAPESDRIATGSYDGSVCVWDVASGNMLLELGEHTDWVREVTFRPDGGEMASAADDGTVVTCDARTGERHFTFRIEKSGQRNGKNGVHTVAYSPRNSFIAGGTHSGCVYVWNFLTGDFIAAFKVHTSWVPRVMFTPDGWDVLSYGSDDAVRLWSIRDALRLS
ncbi:WD40 repeat-like protein [Phanerochaete sordida]|uniref:WD40 repeat-like protein n=1 Tax=Phanerochaete sordida TaxID=48140 RepID=A0A9P3GAU7_9APHY|nr:WD40 repeat-like protein [Phanerochaete sordida]